MANEIQEVRDAVPFPTDESALADNYPGFTFGIFGWNNNGSNSEVPAYWSPARDAWLRDFAENNGALAAITNTFINKIVTVPWHIHAHDRSIARHVKTAKTLEKSFRRYSGSMSSSPIKGFKEAMKMFWKDYLTQDNGAFMVVLGDGPPDGPIIGAPYGLLHLDSALCVRTKDPEYPVKYHNTGRGGDGGWYKIHYTRLIEMSNMPSPRNDLNGVGHCAVSCCLEAAQELWDIYKYSSEMFGSRPPRQILYAETGATLGTLEQAILAWNMKLDNENRQRFGGTLLAAPSRSGAELRLKLLNLSQMPEGFNRRDTTTIDMSSIASAFGMDLRDVAYTLGAPSRTGDAEVQDRKGRGKGVGEALETFTERFNEICLNNDNFYIQFDYMDDEQDEQQSTIRGKRSEARQRDLMAGLTTIRTERELMLENGEISQENFDDMELADGRLPDGLDVLLLFQSQDSDVKEWLDLGVSDPTNVTGNDAEKMIEEIHTQQLEVSEYIHLQTQSDRRRKARQALAALEKLRLMYQEKLDAEMAAEAAEQQMVMAQQGVKPQADNPPNSGSKPPAPPVRAGQSPTGKTPATPPTQPIAAGQMRNGQDLTKEMAEILWNDRAPLTFASKQVEEIDPLLDDYELRFRQLADSALDNEISKERFEELLGILVFNTLTTVFLSGARKSEGELTMEEWRVILEEGEPHYQAIRGLSNDIFSPDSPYNANRQSIYTRIVGWLNMASGFYFVGETYRSDDPMLRWVYSVFKDHCRDCVRLDGQVHRASEWRAAGWIPRQWNLECHGIHCGCFFEQTEAPAQGGF